MSLARELKVRNLMKQRYYIQRKLAKKLYFQYEGVLFEENIRYFQEQDVIVAGPIEENFRKFYVIQVKDLPLTHEELAKCSEYEYDDNDEAGKTAVTLFTLEILVFVAALIIGFAIRIAWRISF